MTQAHLKLVTPATVKRTVTPKRLPNADLRTREHLTEAEVERLMAAARKNRWGHRDATMILTGLPARLPGGGACGPSLGSGASSRRGRCTSAGSSEALQAPTRSSGTSYAPCGASSASRSPSRPTYSLRSGERPSAPLGSLAWSSGRASRPSWGSRRTPTCSGTPAATPWRTRGTTPAPCKPISAIATSSTRCATPSYRRRGSGISGGAKCRQQMPPFYSLSALTSRLNCSSSCSGSRTTLTTRRSLLRVSSRENPKSSNLNNLG